MKKLMIIAMLFVAFSASAQSRFETSAKATVEKMSSVISITEEESAAIYQLELEAGKNISEIRKANATDLETIKLEVGKLNSEKNANVKAILGKDRYVKWSNFHREERKNKQ